MTFEVAKGWRSPRAWAALAILIAAFFLESPLQGAIYHPIARLFGLHMIDGGMMGLAPYGTLMVVRLVWNIALVLAVCAALGRSVTGFPITGPAAGRFLATGLAIGLVVMVAAILAIVASGAATVSMTDQSTTAMLGSGGGWLFFDLLGATGEELYGRVAILLVAEHFVGMRGAILASGLMFLAIHLGNPGASMVWLFRLFLQGMLLAYAVYRTGSLWWSVGYHTGWNWASAPLFGAAGSGYLDRGHLFDFAAVGPGWITGGTVGPEGSVFAFLAVLAACGLLLLTTRVSRSEGVALPGADRH